MQKCKKIVKFIIGSFAYVVVEFWYGDFWSLWKKIKSEPQSIWLGIRSCFIILIWNALGALLV